MAWNNWNDDRRNGGGGWGNDRRGNYPPRNNSYPQRDNYRYNNNGWGNDRREYYDDQPPRQFKYDVGQRMALKARPELTLTIIRHGREQYECRMHDSLDVKWFYEDELMPIEDQK